MERFEHGGNVYAHPGCVDFSANLNPLGMPPAAREALLGSVDACERYPDPACDGLVAALACYERVPEAWVLACAGATDAFARVVRAVRPARALVCAPCYSGYEQALEQGGVAVVRHLLCAGRDFEVGHDVADALDEGIGLAFVANPNNPTGRCVRRDVLVALLERARELGTTVVLDECFIDLTRRRRSNDLLARYANLVLVKALTKSHCLAGLRVGHVLCGNEALLARLREAGQPWAVSVPAQLAGAAAVRDGAYLDEARDLVARERGRLFRALGGVGLRVVASEANFLLFCAPRGLGEALLGEGVLVRACDNYVGLAEKGAAWYRVAVRAPDENARLVEALARALGAPRGDVAAGPAAWVAGDEGGSA